MAAPPAKTAISGSPSRAAANAGFGALYDYLIGLLGSTGNATEARTALGTDIYKKLPTGTASGETQWINADKTVDVGAVEGDVHVIINTGSSQRNLLQGVGVTLRLTGTTFTGSRVVLPYGRVVIHWASGSVGYVSGDAL